jgi:hypothetical protein
LWYIFTVWVCCTNTNLATLARRHAKTAFKKYTASLFILGGTIYWFTALHRRQMNTFLLIVREEYFLWTWVKFYKFKIPNLTRWNRCCDFKNIFAKKLANYGCKGRKTIVTLDSKKNAIFSWKIRWKIAKLVIISLTTVDGPQDCKPSSASQVPSMPNAWFCKKWFCKNDFAKNGVDEEKTQFFIYNKFMQTIFFIAKSCLLLCLQSLANSWWAKRRIV